MFSITRRFLVQSMVVLVAIALLITGTITSAGNDPMLPDNITDATPFAARTKTEAQKLVKEYGLKGLDYSAMEAVTMDGVTLVRVPAPNYSGVVIGFQGGKAVSTYAMQNEEQGDYVFSRTWSDGRQIAEATSDPRTDKVLEGWVMGPDGVKVDIMTLIGENGDQTVNGIWSWFACLHDCFGLMNIPNWVLLTIASTCGAVCVGSLGAGCLACTYGIAIAAGLEGVTCVSACRDAW